jgi:PAS domain S-box-containing protein
VSVRHSKAEPLGRRSPSKANRLALAPDILDRTNPFARILDLAADAIIAVNVRESIVFFNRSAEAVFGHSAQEVRAKPLKLLFRGGLAGFNRGQTAAPAPPRRNGVGYTREAENRGPAQGRKRVSCDGIAIQN